MQSSSKSLPDSVVAELKRGNFVAAAKLLRESGMSFKEAMAAAADYSGAAVSGKRTHDKSASTGAKQEASSNPSRVAQSTAAATIQSAKGNLFEEETPIKGSLPFRVERNTVSAVERAGRTVMAEDDGAGRR